MENQGAQAGVGGVPGSGRARVGEGGVGPEAEKGVWGASGRRARESLFT